MLTVLLHTASHPNKDIRVAVIDVQPWSSKHVANDLKNNHHVRLKSLHGCAGDHQISRLSQIHRHCKCPYKQIKQAKSFEDSKYVPHMSICLSTLQTVQKIC